MTLTIQIQKFLCEPLISPYLEVFVYNGTVSDIADAICCAENQSLGKKWVFVTSAISYLSTVLCSTLRAICDLALAILSLPTCLSRGGRKACKTYFLRSGVHLGGMTTGMIGTVYPKAPLLATHWILKKMGRQLPKLSNKEPFLNTFLQSLLEEGSFFNTLIDFYREGTTIDLLDAAHRTTKAGRGKIWTSIDSAITYSYTAICSGIRFIQNVIVIGLFTSTHPLQKNLPPREVYKNRAIKNLTGIANGLAGIYRPQLSIGNEKTSEDVLAAILAKLFAQEKTLRSLLEKHFSDLSAYILQMLPPLLNS